MDCLTFPVLFSGVVSRPWFLLYGVFVFFLGPGLHFGGHWAYFSASSADCLMDFRFPQQSREGEPNSRIGEGSRACAFQHLAPNRCYRNGCLRFSEFVVPLRERLPKGLTGSPSEYSDRYQRIPEELRRGNLEDNQENEEPPNMSEVW